MWNPSDIGGYRTTRRGFDPERCGKRVAAAPSRVNATDFEFVAQNREIAAVRELMTSPMAVLTR